MKRPRRIFVAMCGAFLCPMIGFAGGPDVRETPDIYEKEGPFVRYPARGAYVIMFVPAALVGSIVCLPVGAVRDRNKYWDCALGGAGNAAWGFAGIVGAPFYGLKKACWDGPKHLLKGNKKPSGNQDEQRIECGSTSMTPCYGKALELCPQGYFSISETNAKDNQTSGAKNQMIIRCKPSESGGASP